MVVMSITIMVTVWVVEFIFMICEPGERMSNEFDVFGEELGRCNWYLLSPEMQRIYLIFLLDTQQPVNMKSYGNVLCTRDTFKKVKVKIK